MSNRLTSHIFGIISLLIFSINITNAQIVAFPGAEGFGKYATGGRGGIVVKVTNLNDSGTGSLRDALTGSSYKKKARTIVFTVSGTIELASEIQIKYDSCITIAGQTAPGGGICIKNFPISILSSQNIIIRYMRFRLGDVQTCTDCDLDAFTIKYSHYIMLDHCSFSWSIDDILDLTDTTGYTTVQYCILSEPLNNSKHSKGAHGYAAGWDGNSRGDHGIFGGSTFHHNLIACANSRSPRLDSYKGMDNTGCRDLMDVVNNVIYNWNSYGAYGGNYADVNWQNNYYRYGPNTSKKYQIFQPDDMCKIYVSGNYIYGYSSVTSDNTKGIYVYGTGVATTAQLDTILLSANPMSSYSNYVTNMVTAEAAYADVLENAGATLPARDTVDRRIVYYVKNGTGAIIDTVAKVGGWPTLSSTTAPTDTDLDGMPDSWEITAGLNSTDASDRNGDVNSNGYTDLEDYLNGVSIVASSVDVVSENKNFTSKIYPNPAYNNLFVELNLDSKADVKCSLLDLTGKVISVFYEGELPAGVAVIPYNNSDLSGIAICKIECDGKTDYKKVIFVR
jgi:hypothetical protein